jgi:DHA1 family bicyclomycin/chloramphenicol resistance-like MFS transporter
MAEPSAPKDRGLVFRPLPAESLAVGALLTALVALGQISTSIYIPSLPSLVSALDASQHQANLTLAVFLLGFAPAQLVFGTLSDRFGRRPILAIGLAAYVLASAACAMAPTIAALLVGRFVQGMAACTGPVLSRAIIRDIYGPDRSATALAYVGAALAISPAVAPIIGGYLQIWFGWRSGFVFLVAVGLLMLLAAMRILPETSAGENRDAAIWGGVDISVHRRVLIEPVYWANTLAVGWAFAGLMAYTIGAPFVFIDLLGLAPNQFGMLAVFSVAGYLAGSLVAARLSRRLAPPRLMPIGLALCVAGGGAMSGFALGGVLTVPAVIGPMAIFSSGLGFVFASGIAGAMAPFPQVAGVASAWLGFLQMLVAAATTTVLGIFKATSAAPMAFTVLASAILAALCYGSLFAGRRRRD